jgi:hypothetical protein
MDTNLEKIIALIEDINYRAEEYSIPLRWVINSSF